MSRDRKPEQLVSELRSVVGDRYLITDADKKVPYCTGWRFGSGSAIAVLKPGTLTELWHALVLCVEYDVIVVMQAANTGLTGGSTPSGDDYDRDVVVINTMRIDAIHIIDEGRQIIGLPGSTLFGLEDKLAPYDREPHSVIGSSCIGASIVGGICNNSGGALVQRGPAYTELSLFAQINEDGTLELVNELGIELGDSPLEMIQNLESRRYGPEDIRFPAKLASDNEYTHRVREVDSPIPARFNADGRRLHEASGCAGKLAVFAVRLDTFPIPSKRQVFYVGSNDPDVFETIRRDVLTNFESLPISGEYIHRECYDATKKYGKDTFVVIDKLGSEFIPKLFALRRWADRMAKKLWFMPEKFTDYLMQFLSMCWPNHLPRRMEEYRDLYEHHWVIEMADGGVDEARAYLDNLFSREEGGYFECTEKEGRKAILHRFVAGSAIGRCHALNRKKFGAMMTMDIAFPRNELKWFEELPKEIDDLLEVKLYYGHLFCHVLHQNYIVKKGVDAKELKAKLLATYDERGAKYPAEHNVGHEYRAEETLRNFYRSLDPTNSFNPGIGKTSKKKHWS
ncbi:MAG: D-lactate dehydrogenase [Phycisphaerae bacterium]|nr:D-lactate dehydrogenase [Phycisphaerae bacterium]|tara:strand:- start:799 stop:2499 length:1701 start_codon:yes stop_codon:yes gene_type:complete